MYTYYFTYGTANQPFYGGWTEVVAPSIGAACELFRAYHPDKIKGLLNCSSVYSEIQFDRTGMRNGNFGHYCHERISVIRVIND